MRNVNASIYLTLDGVMEAPEQWSLPFFDEAAGRYATEQLFASDGLLLGRRTYEGFAAAWPGRPAGDPFTDRMNAMPKHVVTTTLRDLEWNNATALGGDVAAEVTRLKRQPGDDLLVYGSGALTRTLLELDLIDELRLWVHPVVAGSGGRLFDDVAGTKRLNLVDARTLDSGVAILTYGPS